MSDDLDRFVKNVIKKQDRDAASNKPELLEMMTRKRYLVKLLQKAFGNKKSSLITEKDVTTIIKQEIHRAILLREDFKEG